MSDIAVELVERLYYKNDPLWNDLNVCNNLYDFFLKSVE